MNRIIFKFLFIFSIICQAQNNDINHDNIRKDFNFMINTLSKYYAYKNEKKVNFKCIQEKYIPKINNIKSEEESVLFFEYILDEFYDSHLILNASRQSSYRLFSPIYASIKDDRILITNVWKTQIDNLTTNIIGAEILKFNNTDFENVIKNFPTHCHNKQDLEIKEWIVNKILSGRYNQKRILELRLKNGKIISFDLDKLKTRKENDLISYSKKGEFGLIRINNSLGKYELVNTFDKALDSLFDTRGLIIDLRNTVDGGDTYEARGIMSRFIQKSKPYQKHSIIEKSNNEKDPEIERSWVEYVSPRLKTYHQPIVVLVGRWTGSMGEGLAIGLEGIGRAEIIGTEMERLAGEVWFFSFKHRNYGFRFPAAKLFHINGTPREEYIPTNYVVQTSILSDQVLEKGIDFLRRRTSKK